MRSTLHSCYDRRSQALRRIKQAQGNDIDLTELEKVIRRLNFDQYYKLIIKTSGSYLTVPLIILIFRFITSLRCKVFLDIR
jgi:hypothetical protein